MLLDDKLIEKVLTEGNYVSPEDVKRARASSRGNGGFIEFLKREGIVTADILGQAVAESLGIPYANLHTVVPSDEQLLKIPAERAKALRAILFSETKTAVTIATDDPQRAGLMPALATLFPKRKITVAYSTPEDIQAQISRYRTPLETRFSRIIEEAGRIAPQIIGEILKDALSYRASDVHFEPQGDQVLVRFRVDGVLQNAGRLPRANYENILNRIKVQGKMRIDEHFAAQDGSMHLADENADIRISVIPTTEGEKVVMRILASYVEGFSLENLGLSEHHRSLLKAAADKPFGLILVVGPTGSGKSTTLYALIHLLNDPGVNITTIEDPVEYKVRGVNQIQVNLQTNLTFAKGLRSIVRQDPDIILVGEIRDQETSEIAVNAALTGHRLLSTFHANDAATAIPRLLDMGIEPFLLASTLEAVLSQRLVRHICRTCRYGVTVARKDLPPGPASERFRKKTKILFYKGKGCSACAHTGYLGRTAIFEMITMTPELQELTLKSPSSQEIWKLAREQGASSLFEDGLEKVERGITTLEELMRVAEPPVKAMIQTKKKPKR